MGIKKRDFKAAVQSSKEDDFSVLDALPEVFKKSEVAIPKPKKTTKKSEPKKEAPKKPKVKSTIDSLVIDESQFPAIQFALSKCLNLFQAEKFDAPSSPTSYFKKEWKKILEEIENLQE